MLKMCFKVNRCFGLFCVCGCLHWRIQRLYRREEIETVDNTALRVWAAPLATTVPAQVQHRDRHLQPRHRRWRYQKLQTT